MISQLELLLEKATKNKEYDRAYMYAWSLDYYKNTKSYTETINKLIEKEKEGTNEHHRKIK